MTSKMEEIIESLYDRVDVKHTFWKYTPSERSLCSDIIQLHKEMMKEKQK